MNKKGFELGNRRWFAFWYGRTEAMDRCLRAYSEDHDAPAKVEAMTWPQRFAFAETIGLIKDDGTGVIPFL